MINTVGMAVDIETKRPILEMFWRAVGPAMLLPFAWSISISGGGCPHIGRRRHYVRKDAIEFLLVEQKLFPSAQGLS